MLKAQLLWGFWFFIMNKVCMNQIFIGHRAYFLHRPKAKGKNHIWVLSGNFQVDLQNNKCCSSIQISIHISQMVYKKPNSNTNSSIKQMDIILTNDNWYRYVAWHNLVNQSINSLYIALQTSNKYLQVCRIITKRYWKRDLWDFLN